MTHDANVFEQSGGPLLILYTVVETAGVYVDYLLGLRVEEAFGGQVSLLFFLVVFAAVLILGFPISLWMTRLFGKGAPAPSA